MRKLESTAIGVALALACAIGATAWCANDVQRIDDDWRFTRGEQAGAEKTAFDDATWEKIDLPHDWSIAGPIDVKNATASAGGFFPAGVGWYRKKLTPPADAQGKRFALRFDGVYMLSEVWLNGQSLGVHPYGYTPFSYDITSLLKAGQDNTLSIRVDNSKQINSRWYSGSGIYRHVWLESLESVHIADHGVVIRTASASNESATLAMTLTAENQGGPEDATLEFATDIFALDPQGHRAGKALASFATSRAAFAIVDGKRQQTMQVETKATLPAPRWWSPESPNRYVAVTTATVAGKIVDTRETPFGIRTLEVSADKGFLLNGKRVLLYGGCVHHDNGALGAAAFDRAEERKVELLKAAGFNAVRTSHNPPSPAFLEACDRLGLMVVDEAFDCWLLGKNSQDYAKYFRQSWKQDLDAMVLRDRNHPSVIIWSIGNEIPDFGSKQGLETGTMLINRVKELDPTRPVTAAVNWWNNMGGKEHDWKWNDADALMSKLDVVGYNYQINRYPKDHQRVPDRVIASTESYPRDMYLCWESSAEKPWIVGDFVWTAMDYLGESGIGRVWYPGEKVLQHWSNPQFPYHGAYCGDIDITGFRKPISYARNVTWDRGEKLYTSVIEQGSDGKPLRTTDWSVVPSQASWTWAGMEGKTLQVQVYSRYDTVRLSLNGAVIGEKPTGKDEKFKAVFDLPYAPGTLVTEGISGVKVMERQELKTAGAVAGLRLTADRKEIHADGQDLAFVTVESIDADGNLQPQGNQEVQFEVEGAGTNAGVASGDMSTTESYHGSTRALFKGRAQVVVRAGKAPGTVRVRATSGTLKVAKLSLEAR